MFQIDTENAKSFQFSKFLRIFRQTVDSVRKLER